MGQQVTPRVTKIWHEFGRDRDGNRLLGKVRQSQDPNGSGGKCPVCCFGNDGSELGLALKLLRQRHLVLPASVRERVVGELISQPLTSGNAALDVASAHLYEQSRRDAFRRLSARDALIDVT